MCAHPRQRPPYYKYKAIISESKLCVIVSNLPLTRGHSSYKAIFSIPQWWPHKMGATVHLYDFTNTRVYNVHTVNAHTSITQIHVYIGSAFGKVI